MNGGDISFETYISGPLTDKVRSEYFGAIEDVCPLLTPQRIGNTEPVKTSFSVENAKALWRDVFIWIAPKARAVGMVFWANAAYGETVSRFSIHLRPNTRGPTPEILERLGKRFFSSLAVEYQFLHRVKSCDLDRGRRNHTIHSEGGRYRLDVPTFYLESWLPDLFDINFFGPRYCRLFGRQLLKDCAAGGIEQIAKDKVILDFQSLRLASEIQTSEFEEKREKMKICLGAEMFFREGDTLDIKKKTPFSG